MISILALRPEANVCLGLVIEMPLRAVQQIDFFETVYIGAGGSRPPFLFYLLINGRNGHKGQ